MRGNLQPLARVASSATEEVNSQIDSVEGENVAVIGKVIAKYVHHLRSITVIRQLILLITVAQQHRGTNLALLEGDSSFADEVIVLQTEIDNRFATLQILNQELSTPIPPLDLTALMQEWKIVRDWSGENALENFNLHSNFIEQQMKLMWHVTEKTHCFVFALSSGSSQSDSLAGDSLLIEYILHEAPEFMELLARLRGLATHACVIGTCDSDHSSWLGGLLNQLNLKKERFRVLSKRLQKYSLRDVPAMVDLQIQDVRIVQLIQLVENRVLHQDRIELDSHHIFSMATNIVNSQKEVVRQGLDFIQNKIHRQLDGWYDEAGEHSAGI